MKPRIFSLMLLAFALVIILGIGGMTTFFWLAVISFERGHGDWSPPPEFYARVQSQQLAELYARDRSWANVEPRFAELERELPKGVQALALLDADGRLVRSSGAGLAPFGVPPDVSPPFPPDAPQPPDGPFVGGLNQSLTLQRVPIRLDGAQVGTLVLLYSGSPGGGDDSVQISSIGRGFLSAALALAVILLGMAALFSGRISSPLRQLNRAAESLASGDLRARVRPPMLRELADLALSFNRMADSLEAADQQRRQLTADVAHELRTPLSIIKGRLEGVQDGIYRADPAQIDGLLDEVALLERLIDDLRLLALADAGQLALYVETVDPAHLVRDAQRSFAQQAEQRGVSLRSAPSADLPELSADPQRIAQVLGNLVVNALRHTPPGGTVGIGATHDGSAVTFAVCDSGSGIDPADLPYIFDRFYRADRSRTRGSGGAGLGLAIARRIVEAHSGRIWAVSVPGQGATVSFTLPLA